MINPQNTATLYFTACKPGRVGIFVLYPFARFRAYGKNKKRGGRKRNEFIM